MKEAVTPITKYASTNTSVKPALRLFAGTVLLATMAACTTVPTEPVETTPVVEEAPDYGLTSANVMYNTRNYSGAVGEFDALITDSESSANSIRLSHLGKALIYLSTDKNWHSIENAKMSLNAAGNVTPDSDA